MLFQIREETFVIEHFLLCDSSRGNRKPNFLRPFPATKQSSAERAFKRPKNGSSKSTNISIAFKEHLTDTKDSDLRWPIISESVYQIYNSPFGDNDVVHSKRTTRTRINGKMTSRKICCINAITFTEKSYYFLNALLKFRTFLIRLTKIWEPLNRFCENDIGVIILDRFENFRGPLKGLFWFQWRNEWIRSLWQWSCML